MEGITNQVSIGKETTFNTPVAPTLTIPIKPSNGLIVNQEVNGAEAIKGTPPKNKAFYKGRRTFSGGYDMDLYPLFIGHILRSVLGNVSSGLESGETIVYTHAITEGISKPSYTLEQKIGTIVKRFAGTAWSSFKFSAKVGETLQISLDGMAMSSADATAITPAYETSKVMDWTHIAALSIAAVDIKAKVESIDFTYTNGLEHFYGLGNVDPQKQYVKQSELKGSIVLYVDTSTDDYLTDNINLTESQIILDIVADAIGVAKNNRLKFTFPKCAVTKYSTSLSFDYNKVTLDFEGREDITNGLLKADLTNLQASY